MMKKDLDEMEIKPGILNAVFQETVTRYELRGMRLARAAEVTPNQIINMKTGKADVRMRTWESVLLEMPAIARRYLLSRLIEEMDRVGRR